ncbi:hypothetical protein FRC08_007397 [Ceratobasidium sp. 394]|nr:hypothetical protein FRC08_007397 [Ceratobasidium sp. 394]
MMAQARENATQPGPLTPSKHRKHTNSLLDRSYAQLEAREDRIEWLLSALEFRNPRKNYRESEFEVEELEEMMNEMSDADADEAPRRGFGVYLEASKTIEQIKAPKNAKSQPATLPSNRAASSSTTKGAPPLATAPTLSSPLPRKPVPTSKDARPTAKISKARFNELRKSQANTRPATGSNRMATEVAGDRHPGPGPSKPAGSSQARPRGNGNPSEARPPAPKSARPPAPNSARPHASNSARHPVPPNNTQQPARPEGAQRPPRRENAHHPAPPENARRPAPTNGNSRGVRHPLPDNGKHRNALPAAQIVTPDDDADDADNIDDANDANEDDEADGAHDNEPPRRDPPKKRSKKMDAQLREFGEATPISFPTLGGGIL